jgi:hypothetical protein
MDAEPRADRAGDDVDRARLVGRVVRAVGLAVAAGRHGLGRVAERRLGRLLDRLRRAVGALRQGRATGATEREHPDHGGDGGWLAS